MSTLVGKYSMNFFIREVPQAGALFAEEAVARCFNGKRHAPGYPWDVTTGVSPHFPNGTKLEVKTGTNPHFGATLASDFVIWFPMKQGLPDRVSLIPTSAIEVYDKPGALQRGRRQARHWAAICSKYDRPDLLPSIIASMPLPRKDLLSDSGEVEWYTPPIVFQALGLEFDLDPAAPTGGNPNVPAARWYSLAENGDGLSLPWEGRIWLNPPYSGAAASWMRKMAEHGNGVALVNAHVETKWFHEVASSATTVGFVRGRIAFFRPDGTRGGRASVNSVFLAWGEDNAQALEQSGLATCFRPVSKAIGLVNLAR